MENSIHFKLSPIVAGTMSYGKGGKDLSAKEVTALIRQTFETGITSFDLADIYGDYTTESLFGEGWKNAGIEREKVQFITKCGIKAPQNTRPEYKVKHYDTSRDHIIWSAENSLKNIQTDYLDLLLIHRPDPLMEPDEVARAFSELQASGKVRYFGVSNFSAAQIIFLQKSLDQKLAVNQMQLSLLHHHMINEGIMVNTTSGQYAGLAGTMDYCRKHNILLQAWSPVAGGRLINPKGDTNNPTNKVAQEIRKMAQQKQTSPEAIALAWLLRHPAQIQPVVGTTRLGRLEASLPAPQIELTRSEWYRLFEKARGSVIP